MFFLNFISLFSLVVFSLSLILTANVIFSIIETEKNFNKKKAKIYLILSLLKSLQEKSAFLKISAQAFETGDFLSIFLRFWGFEAQDFSYKKACN